MLNLSWNADDTVSEILPAFWALESVQEAIGVGCTAGASEDFTR